MNEVIVTGSTGVIGSAPSANCLPPAIASGA